MSDYNAAQAGLQLWAEFVNDIEGLRVAQDNRVRSLEAEGVPIEAWQAAATQLQALEKHAVGQLERAMKTHPLGDFVKRTKGLGFKQMGRLLAALGDPIYNEAEERYRRGPAELWKYCGLAPDQRKQRGERAAWNHDAKMRAWLITESCVKAVATDLHDASPYRVLYDDCRAHYADRVHVVDCKRCGPSGKPALAGSPLSDGHKHAMAKRRMMKELLKDLYNERKLQVVGDQGNFVVAMPAASLVAAR
jgi:hypothetical protein